jgi:hypothetical protein
MDEHMSDRREEHWRVDKKIPLVLIFSVLVQTVIVIIFFTRMDGRVGTLEDKMKDNGWQAERIIRMDERLNSLQTSMGELKTMLTARTNQKL